MEILRAGVIGLGVGEQHVRSFLRHPNCEVAAVCDFAEDKLNTVMQLVPEARTGRNAEDILSDRDIDVVSIASYDNYHCEQVLGAIRNGKHVFVEKPMCLREEEAIRIREALNENPGIRLSSNLIMRCCPRFQRLKTDIQDGSFGNLFYVEGDYNYGRLHKITEGWRGKLDFYSVMLGGGVHMVDLLIWLTGERVTEVTGFGNGIASQGSGFQFNDLVASLLRFENGLVGKVAANFGCVYPHFHPISIYGTKATFKNELQGGLTYTSRDPEDSPEKIDEAYPGVGKGELIENFVDVILSDSEPIVTEEDVFESLSVCFGIEASICSGKPVRVKYI